MPFIDRPRVGPDQEVLLLVSMVRGFPELDEVSDGQLLVDILHNPFEMECALAPSVPSMTELVELLFSCECA